MTACVQPVVEASRAPQSHQPFVFICISQDEIKMSQTDLNSVTCNADIIFTSGAPELKSQSSCPLFDMHYITT